MNAAEVREAVKANEEACLEMGHSLSLDDLGRIAQTVFPAGRECGVIVIAKFLAHAHKFERLATSGLVLHRS
jgi:hypothetical protein